MIPQNIFNGIERGVLLPLSDCNCSNIFLSSQHFAGIVVNKKFFFNSDDIDVCKNIHHIKEVQSKLEKETAWFKRAKKARVPCSSLKMQKKYLDTFEEILSVGKNACANRANPCLLISDLSLLAGQEWLSLEMMEEFIKKINVEIKNTTNISLVN